ncbi:MAG: hydrogenase maturation nickel metallochaperone HypA [Thermomicrobium sp.]
MHELAIASSLVETLAERFRERPRTRITAIYLRIGPLAGVVESALQAAFEVVAQGTLAEGARLEIEHTSLKVRCRLCGHEQVLANSAENGHDTFISCLVALPALCPQCGAPGLDLVQGDELDLVAAEVIDDERLGDT